MNREGWYWQSLKLEYNWEQEVEWGPRLVLGLLGLEMIPGTVLEQHRKIRETGAIFGPKHALNPF